jgi:DNA-binding CsgD family transcriptional regulator
VFLERCINPWCKYELEFRDYATLGKSLSDGFCPLCEGHTIFGCPNCRGLDVVKHILRSEHYFLRGEFACRRCGSALNEVVKQQRLAMLIRARTCRNIEKCEPLSPREIEVVKLLAAGFCTKEIAVALSISVRTAETYRARIRTKVHAHSCVEIVHYAIRHQLLLPSDFLVPQITDKE